MILGIDQGTTGTRARLTRNDGSVAAQAYRTHAQHTPHPGWVEHDPEEIWRNVDQVCSKVSSRVGPGDRIEAIGLANQGETILLWERATGRPLYPAIVWQDTRTQAWIDDLGHDESIRREIAARTGLALDSYFSASKLRWLLDNMPGARNRAATGELCAGTIDTWMIWHFTAGQRFVTDVSTAARTLLFNIHDLAWDPYLLDLFDIPRAILPDALPSLGDFGSVHSSHALGGVPIRASLVDQPAALAGHGCTTPGQAKITFGTGAFVYMNSGGEASPSRNGILRTIAWSHAGRTTYALDGGIFAAGSVVNWLRDGLGLAATDQELDELGSSTDNCGGVTCVPALAGLAAPYWRRDAKAAWLGMSLGTTRAHLVRSAFEGVACRVAQVVQAMERDCGRRLPALRADGGVSASRALMQLQADLLGIPVEVSAEPEATVCGATALAAVAAGIWSEADLARRAKAARVYEPAISCDERAGRLETFDRAARLVAEWSSR